jgi:hypothetical protein
VGGRGGGSSGELPRRKTGSTVDVKGGGGGGEVRANWGEKAGGRRERGVL